MISIKYGKSQDDIKNCPDNIPLPDKYDKKTFNESLSTLKKPYEAGLKINFKCEIGYYAYSPDLSTTCGNDGTWNPLPDCKFFNNVLIFKVHAIQDFSRGQKY